MGFRISDTSIFANAIRSARLNRFDLSHLQAQLSAGKRITSLGDDASDAAEILGLRRSDRRLEQYERNIDAARQRLEPTEGALAGISNMLIDMRELTLRSQQPLEVLFKETIPAVEQAFDEVLQVSNTRIGDSYLFAGFASDSPAFTQTGAFVPQTVDNTAPSGTWNGDNGVIQIQVGDASNVNASIPGNKVFLGDFDGDGATDANRVDLFATLRELRNRLIDPANEGQPTEMTDAFDQAIEQIVEIRAEIGATLNRLDNTESQVQSLRINLEGRRSSIEDLDIIKAATDLANRENTYQASLAVTARVIQPSLLNFLS